VACDGKYPTLDGMPQNPADEKMMQWFLDAGLSDPHEAAMLRHFCYSKLPATNQMLPKMISLLQCCHAPDQNQKKLTQCQLYYYLQESVMNHFKTEGSCLFIDDAKEILSGQKEYMDMSGALGHPL
jgi:hypothetical protein